MIVCCEHTVRTTVSDIGQLFTVSAGGRQVSHSRLTDWLDDTAPGSPLGDTRWTLNCGDRLRRTGRTARTRLRIKSAVLLCGCRHVIEYLGKSRWSGQEGGMAAVDLDGLHA